MARGEVTLSEAKVGSLSFKTLEGHFLCMNVALPVPRFMCNT